MRIPGAKGRPRGGPFKVESFRFSNRFIGHMRCLPEGCKAIYLLKVA